MKNALLIKFIVILWIALFYQPTFVVADTMFFDLNGKAIDKTQYAQNATDREKTIGMKLGNGYNVDPPAWKDPIKLRKKRIEQWKQMRSHYSPDSLPSKIETPLPKNP